MRAKAHAVRVAAMALMIVAAMAAGARADVIVEHHGNTDPVTEGWTYDEREYCTSGPVTGDMGYDAWFTDDGSTLTGSVARYQLSLTGDQVAAARALGWSAQVRVRVPGVDDAPDGAVVFYFSDGQRNWILNFGSDASGNQVTGAQTSDVYPPTGPLLAGSDNGYRLYEITYDPDAQTATVLADGTEWLSDWSGYAYAGETFVRFGSAASLDSGRGNWNLVSFEIVPEPATMGLLALGLSAMLVRRGKRRQQRAARSCR